MSERLSAILLDDMLRKLEEIHATQQETLEGDVRARPVSLVKRYDGSDTNYQKVVSWTVGRVWGRKHGRLDEISMNSDNYSKTLFRLTIAGGVFFSDLQLQSVLTLPFRFPHELPEGREVRVECRSTDGTSIVVTSAITGREW